MKKYDNRKVVIVGCGMVGMSYAYSMINQNICDELVLIDINEARAKAEADDLAQGMPFAPSTVKVYAGDYSDCRDADIVAITAGAPQREGETRRDLLQKNYKVFQSIVNPVIKSGFDGVFLVASNPVDVMTQVVYELSGFPAGRVVGSGTSLDSARLRHMMGDYFHVNPQNVHAYVIGEHGDSEFVAWSNAYISVNSLSAMQDSVLEDMKSIALSVRDTAYSIIASKGATYYAIGMVLARLTMAILQDENRVFSVSTLLRGEYGEKGLYIGVPAIVNRNGVREILEMRLSKEEKELFRRSATIIKEMLKEIEL